MESLLSNSLLAINPGIVWHYEYFASANKFVSRSESIGSIGASGGSAINYSTTFWRGSK